MSKNTNNETTQTPAEETQKVIVVNWKAAAKYAAIAAALVGAGAVVAHTLASSADEETEEAFEETKDLIDPTE